MTKAEQLKNHIREQQTIRKLPYEVTFELTPLCNFNCKMCYIHLYPDQVHEHGKLLSTQQWIHLAKQACDAGVLTIGLTGGEVFTRPDFRTIYENIYDMGVFIVVLSNGYLIDEKAVEWLCKRKPVYIKITIYGASNDTYKKVCGIENGFTRVTENILRLKEAGITVLTTMTVIKDNENDIEAVLNWAHEHDISCFYSDKIRKPVRGADSNALSVRLDVEQIPDCDDNIEHIGDLYPFETGKPFSCCKNYWNSCIISWQGNMHGCNFINTISQSTLAGDFVENFRHLWDQLDNIHQPAKCINCKYLRFCNPCPGNLEGESGNPEVSSPYICEIARYNYRTYNLAHNSTKPLQMNHAECE